jgi:glycosyltransferase involved in cell wall biosynthesis
MIVNQWVPAAHAGDAVGDHTRALRGLLRSWGHESDIYAIDIDDSLAGDVRPWDHAGSRGGDVTILHFATASAMTDGFGRLPGTKVLHYHNVTPAHFFAGFDEDLCARTSRGRQELATLAGRTDVALGASQFSCQELAALGFATPAVLPIAIDLRHLRAAPPVPALEHVLQDGLANILYVGRIAPHKKIEDHIRLAEQYRRYIDSDYRFIFVGRHDGLPAYYAAIRSLILGHRLPADRFWFTGPVPAGELAAYYRHAHAYVSLSEHEGFCVPLVEAMAMDVPVLAYAEAAVPETLGGAGVAFAPKDLEYAAELLGALVYDEPLRAQVLAGERRRVQDFEHARVASRIKTVLSAVGI